LVTTKSEEQRHALVLLSSIPFVGVLAQEVHLDEHQRRRSQTEWFSMQNSRLYS